MSDCIASENDFLDLLDHYFGLSTPHQLTLRGDDCAELAMPEAICLSSDLFLEDVHFRTAYFSFYELGHKALAVNLSDLAAAGASPLGFNMNLSLPPHTLRQSVEELLAGMSALAARFHLPLTGGDLSAGQKLGLCITIWGERAGPKFLRRGGCRPGDTLFIAADSLPLPLGLPRAALHCLEKTGRAASLAELPEACRRHFLPNPLVKVGMAIARLAPGTSLMDLSDGLARDLPRLLGCDRPASKTSQPAGPGAEIVLPQELLHPELLAWCRQESKSGPCLDAMEEALLGGEDYLLLGSTNQPELLPSIEAASGAHCLVIGRVREEGGLILNGRAFSQGGFDHFGG